MPGSLSVSATRPLVKHPEESLLFAIDFHRLLSAGELLTGAPTVVANPGGLTIGVAQINTTAIADEVAGTAPAGTAVQVRISAGAAGADYTLSITANTTAGNVRAGVCVLQVRGA